MHIILKVLLVKEKCGAGCRCAGNLTWRAPEIIDARYRCHCTFAAIRLKEAAAPEVAAPVI